MNKFSLFLITIITILICFVSCERNDMYSISLWYKSPPRIIAVDNVANGYIHISDDNGVTWKQYGPQGMWSSVASSSDGMKLAATVSGGYIHTSTDGGKSWVQRGSSQNWSSIASSSDGSKLVAVANGQFAYHSSDSGVTWIQDTFVNENWLQVNISSSGSQAVAVDGTNNSWIWQYDGVIWSNLSITSPPPGVLYSSISSSADGMMLIVGTQGTLDYVYITTNRGISWFQQNITVGLPLNQWVVASSADGIKLAIAAINGYIYTTSDGAASSWIQRESIRNWSSISSSQDGTKLAAGVNGGYIYTSDDSGVTWIERTGAGLRTWKNLIITK